MMKPKTDKQLAKTWACDERTIRRWRRDGAPFDDLPAMTTWLTGRREIPAGTQRLLDAKRKTAATKPKGDLPPGAAHTLARLERSEANAAAALDAALERGDLVGAKHARQNWLAICDSLRKFDNQVVDTRRQTGETVAREEVERILRGVATGWQQGCAAMSYEVNDLVREHPQPSALILRTLLQTWLMSIATVKLPPWVEKCLTAGSRIVEADKVVAEYRDVLAQLVPVMAAHISAALAEEHAREKWKTAEWLRRLEYAQVHGWGDIPFDLAIPWNPPAK